ncbi:hypothetical protein K0M31_013886 [Melipona bicolor]|uniref:Uncharacterized protein n=1 Tax=Melipona bicolor TaxID=60889 RepID=A0AA40G7G4_9HYME|nr:hypothetical protein K0M31_013886 [Melipona bicolor]
MMSTAGSRVSACHLLEPHVLLIQNLKFQPERPFSFRDIRVGTFFENLEYQEHSWFQSLCVPPLRTSRSPDTNSQNSARKAIQFSRYSYWNIFRKFGISGAQLVPEFRRATSSNLMFFWYKI